MFFSKMTELKGMMPPVLCEEGIQFLHIQRGGMYFVACTQKNVSPVMVLDAIFRISTIFRDYCGMLNEQSVRKNFLLVYELLDEVLDFGYIQDTSTESLKTYVFNESVPIDVPKTPKMEKIKSKLKIKDKKTVSSSAAHRPIAFGKSDADRNEIFVDLLEDLQVTFSADGRQLHSLVHGKLLLRNYLMGSPDLTIGLNSDLVIGSVESRAGKGSVAVDDCKFHPCVDMKEFDIDRSLNLSPPEGEFVAMAYRLSGQYSMPFNVHTLFEAGTPFRLDATISIRADYPSSNHGNDVKVKFPVPKEATRYALLINGHPQFITTDIYPWRRFHFFIYFLLSSLPIIVWMCVGSVGFDLDASLSNAEYKSHERLVVWTIKKITGATELILRAKIALSTNVDVTKMKKSCSPITLTFEIPMFNVSGVNVRFLKIHERGGGTSPVRWVRYVTSSKSYVHRLR
jgi:AP-4 complex subunit mu-1